MKAKDFEERFDNGESVMPFADLSGAERPNQKTRRVSMDYPERTTGGQGNEILILQKNCASLEYLLFAAIGVKYVYLSNLLERKKIKIQYE